MTSANLWRDLDRARLVRLCAAISGDRHAADDLAQETLLEAWRIRSKLREPAGFEPWLSAIARNMCRRWARRLGRELPATSLEAQTFAEPRDGLDLDAELERAEMADLVDRALDTLPAVSRQAMRQRYLEDRSVAEIAHRTGSSADAVSMRLSRGKAHLRRSLADDLRQEAESLGLTLPPAHTWAHTRVHCTQCGVGTLLVWLERAPGTIAFRCPRCDSNPAARAVEFQLGNPAFARLLEGLKRPSAILRRADEWSHAYYSQGLETGHVACTQCGARLPLRTYERDDLPPGSHRRGLYADCASCGIQVTTSVSALTLALPEVRDFRRKHPRLRAMPPREVEAHGGPALIVGYEEFGSNARLNAVFAADSLRLLEVHGPSLTAA
ncbi:MAG TPA: RNA polymerase sigma factor [Candidatus Limnocylindria bacterium]|nr:RNA polymerase sigma factor [Candidatus Limnocylindria bacterium]